ncbi:winged helix-turn-helix transcriptional regulator [Pseudonocardia sp. CA-107938]|uniref:winged helix-turn-helix transcriptional regulator n=1 Tax=Pseudonocardia sp. CA-107938 TaxID=3240021 RepID=UPI003D90CCCF
MLQVAREAANQYPAEFDDACPIERAVTVLGRRSTILLLREASYGTSRFDEFVRRTGLTESVTAGQLRKLVDEGLLTKRPYQEPAQRQRFEYVLTDAGEDLLPILIAMGAWGDKHRPKTHRVHMVHADCGAAMEVQVLCEAGHRVAASEVAVVFDDGQPSR